MRASTNADTREQMADGVSPERQRISRWVFWSTAAVVGIAFLIVMLWICIVIAPVRLYPPLTNRDLAGLTRAQRAERVEGRDKVQNDVRTTLLQGLSALLVLAGAGVGAGVTLRQVRIGREQLAVAREGQITERFTRAVDQLGQEGPNRVDVRLGGLYALERIAHDSPTHQPAVIELLNAFVRNHAPWPPRLPHQPPEDAPLEEIPPLRVRAADVQAALTILGRGGIRDRGRGPALLVLDDTDLRNADLQQLHLEYVWLRRAHLEGANLLGTYLTGARLDNAHLENAGFFMVHVDGALLSGVHLQGAEINKEELKAAIGTRELLDSLPD
jgi:hypothetical protein